VAKSTWDESMETGNELIDAQHREVVAILDELQAVDIEAEGKVLQVLDKLMEFTASHFIAEEVLMSQVSYPKAATEQMIEQHNEFNHYARLRVIEFRSGRRETILPLHGFLDEWLKVHEFGVDVALADWIRAQNGKA